MTWFVAGNLIVFCMHAATWKLCCLNDNIFSSRQKIISRQRFANIEQRGNYRSDVWNVHKIWKRHTKMQLSNILIPDVEESLIKNYVSVKIKLSWRHLHYPLPAWWRWCWWCRRPLAESSWKLVETSFQACEMYFYISCTGRRACMLS